MARMTKPSASSAPESEGAKPPSSPVLTLWPASSNSARSAWKTSAPARTASAKLSAPSGTIMNSWMSMGLSACAPPFSTFIIGTGSTWAPKPPT